METDCFNIWTSSPEALLLADAASVLEANPAAVRLFGFSGAEALSGVGLDRAFHPESQQLLQERLHHVLRGGDAQTALAERIIRNDGQERDVEMSIASLPSLPGAVLLTLRDVTERRKVEAALALTADQLRALTKRQGALVEEERQRIAREIHDELGQQLTLAKLRLAALRTGAGARMAAGLDEASATIDGAIRTLRRIATELRPAVLDALGLTAAVEWQARAFQERTGISVVVGRLEEMELGAATSIALFRILQEALTNVARHSQADQVRVALYREADEAVLEIEDNGIGMDRVSERLASSLGLIGMRERAALLGGSLTITSAPGEGTRLASRTPARGAAGAPAG